LKTPRQTRSTSDAPPGRARPRKLPQDGGDLSKLRTRLAVAEETLRAIRTGEVDTVMVGGKEGSQVFTLEGAEHSYRVLIESMNEGALTLTADKLILYANQCFAKMVKCPLEQVISTPFSRFLSAEDQATLRPLVKRAGKSGSKIQVTLQCGDGSQMPAQISIRPTAQEGSNRATLGLVVTDLTEPRRDEELLRGLSNRLVQAQENERGRVALELHDNITQLLCAALVRSQVLAEKLPLRQRALRREALMLHGMLGQIASEVERISQNLRPSVLEHLGLATLLCRDSQEFAERIGVSLQATCVKLKKRLPAETELAFYRILQEALKNVERHAHARHVSVLLTHHGLGVEMTIQDDGVGFDPDRPPGKRKVKPGFGLLSMRERAACVGGVLSVQSDPGQGTIIRVKAPFAKSEGARSHTSS
jgi:PAS domain S-box-containing protein